MFQSEGSHLICEICLSKETEVRESVLYSDLKKNTSIMVDDTSVGALLPGEVLFKCLLQEQIV